MNRKKLFQIVSLGFFVMGLSACDSKIEMDQSNIDSVGDAISSIEDTELPPVGYSVRTFSFYSNYSWKLSGVPSWLSVVPSSGRAGNTVVKISMKTLGGASDYVNNKRAATIIFKSNNGETLKSFTVTQQRPYLYLTAKSKDGKEIEVEKSAADDGVEKIFKWSEYGSADPFIIEAVSNVEWDWSMSTASYNIVKGEAVTSKDDRYYKKRLLTVIPKKHNVDKAPSFSKLSFVALDEKGSSLSTKEADYIHTEWRFEHKNLRFLIDDSPEEKSLDMGEMTAEYEQFDSKRPVQTIKISTEIPWEDLRFENKAKGWLSFDPKISESDSTITFSVDHVNTTNTDRKDQFIISAMVDGSLVSREVTVVQHPYHFEVDFGTLSDLIVIPNDDRNSKRINVSTNGPWTCSCSAEWIKASSESKNKFSDKNFTERADGYVNYYAPNQNLEFSDQVSTISVIGLDGVTYTKSIKHDKFVFELTPPASAMSISTLGQSNPVKIGIDCSGAWEIENASSYSDWINYSVSGVVGITKGETKDKYFGVAVPSVNPNFETDRDATLSILSLNHKNAGLSVKRTVSVRQLRYMWEISKNGQTDNVSFTLPAYDNDVDGPKPTEIKKYPLTIKCSGTWSITDLPEWLKLSATYGKEVGAGQTIYLTPTGNASTSPRSATISVKDSYEHATKTFSVTQEGFLFERDSSQPESYSDIPVMAGRDKKTYTIKFRHTAGSPYLLDIPDGSWIKQSGSEKKTIEGNIQTTTLTVLPGDNGDFQPRSETIKVKSGFLADQSFNVKCTQKPYEFDDSEVEYNYTELAKNNGKTDELNLVCSGDWTTSNCPTWIGMSQKEGASGTKIVFSPDNNTTTSPRSGTITITSTLTERTKKINIHQEAFFFDGEAQSFSYGTLEKRTDLVNFRCSGKWTLQFDRMDVVSPNVKSGDGSEAGEPRSVSFTSLPNLTDKDREAVVEVVSDDNSNLRKKITFSQSKYIFNLLSEGDYTVEPLDESEKTLKVTSTADWRAESSNPGCVDVSLHSSTGTADVKIVPKRNLSKSERFTKLLFVPVYDGKDVSTLGKTIVITQKPFLFSASESSVSFSAALASKNSPKTVYVSHSSTWKVSEIPSGFSVKKYDDSIVITPLDNFTKKEKSGDVVLSSDLGGHIIKIKVSQAAYVFDESAESLHYKALDASSYTIGVTSSGDWAIENTESWISAVKSSKGVVISVQDNTVKSERKGNVIVYSTDNPAFKKIITVTQDAYVFEATPSSLEFSANPESSLTISVKCTSKWKVESCPEWCSYSISGSTLLVSASANEGDERNGVIILSCSNSTLKLEISVKQNSN